jgi:hypothetical protein
VKLDANADLAGIVLTKTAVTLVGRRDRARQAARADRGGRRRWHSDRAPALIASPGWLVCNPYRIDVSIGW